MANLNPDINNYINVNELYASIEKQRLSDGFKRHNITMWCLQVKYKDTERWKGKDVKKFSMQAFIKESS